MYKTFAINESPIDDIRESLFIRVVIIAIILNMRMLIIKIPVKKILNHILLFLIFLDFYDSFGCLSSWGSLNSLMSVDPVVSFTYDFTHFRIQNS